MICRKCKMEIPDSAAICPYCRTRILNNWGLPTMESLGLSNSSSKTNGFLGKIVLIIVGLVLAFMFLISPGIFLASFINLMFDCSSETIATITFISSFAVLIILSITLGYKRGGYVYLGVAAFCSILMVGVTLNDKDNFFFKTFNTMIKKDNSNTNKTKEKPASSAVAPKSESTVKFDMIEKNMKDSIENVQRSEAIIKEFYQYVFNKKEMTDKVLDMYLSKEIKKSLWTEDYDGCYEYWRFRTIAQDYDPAVGDVSRIEEITPQGNDWYIVSYLDMGNEGQTNVKIIDGKIVDLKVDKSWGVGD